jgi:fumarate hydratase, class I
MIKAVEAIDFEGFGMEAAWRIQVEALPAFLVIDDKGNDFYRRVRKQRTRAAAGDVVRPAGHQAG